MSLLHSSGWTKIPSANTKSRARDGIDPWTRASGPVSQVGPGFPSDYQFQYLSPTETDCRSCITWPWDAGYASLRNRSIPDPFTTGILHIKGEVAVLSPAQLKKQWFRLDNDYNDAPVILDNMTVFERNQSMAFLRVYDITTKASEFIMALGLVPSWDGRGTHKRVTSVTLRLEVWLQAKPRKQTVELA